LRFFPQVFTTKDTKNTKGLKKAQGHPGRQVKDHIDLSGDLLAKMWVPDVAAHGQKHFREVGADEAVGAGDKYSLHVGVRPSLLSLLGIGCCD